jgi:hypothetical protein
MKTNLVSITFITSLLAAASLAQAEVSADKMPHKIWSCTSNSDPDFITADIYSVGSRLVAWVSEESGDGDEGAEDLIEVKKVEVEDDALLAFEQVSGVFPRVRGLHLKASHKSRGFRLTFSPFTNEAGTITMVVDTLGHRDSRDDGIECKKQ